MASLQCSNRNRDVAKFSSIISDRPTVDGKISDSAQIRINQDGVQVYQETQSFARKQAAKAWVKKRETELAQPGAIERANRQGVTVKEMIERYLVEVEKVRPLGKTKRGTLAMISESYPGTGHQSATGQIRPMAHGARRWKRQAIIWPTSAPRMELDAPLYLPARAR